MAERDGFVEFVRDKGPALRGTAYLICGDWHRADDALQDALHKLYVAWPRVRRVGNVFAYARRSVVNAALYEGRRTWRREDAYAGTMDQSCGEQSRASCERVVAPNGKIVLYKQIVRDPNKPPAKLPRGAVWIGPRKKAPVTVTRNAAYLQPDGNWAAASVTMRPGDVDRGITKEQLAALVTDPLLDR